MDKSTISMAMFNSKLLVYQRVNLHFPMVFLWFSYGLPGRVNLSQLRSHRSEKNRQGLSSAPVKIRP